MFVFVLIVLLTSKQNDYDVDDDEFPLTQLNWTVSQWQLSGHLPGPAGELTALPIPRSWIYGPTSKGMKGRDDREGEGIGSKGGKGREESFVRPRFSKLPRSMYLTQITTAMNRQIGAHTSRIAVIWGSVLSRAPFGARRKNYSINVDPLIVIEMYVYKN